VTIVPLLLQEALYSYFPILFVCHELQPVVKVTEVHLKKLYNKYGNPAFLQMKLSLIYSFQI